jgi:hypothetical protein
LDSEFLSQLFTDLDQSWFLRDDDLLDLYEVRTMPSFESGVDPPQRNFSGKYEDDEKDGISLPSG